MKEVSKEAIEANDEFVDNMIEGKIDKKINQSYTFKIEKTYHDCDSKDEAFQKFVDDIAYNNFDIESE